MANRTTTFKRDMQPDLSLSILMWLYISPLVILNIGDTQRGQVQFEQSHLWSTTR